LTEEHFASLGLINLTDDCSLSGQTGKRGQESTIGLIAPPHVARTAPAVGSQGVETPVVSDPVVRIGLDRFGGIVTKRSPCAAPPGSLRSNHAKRSGALLAIEASGSIECRKNGIRFRRKDGLGGAAGREIDWS